jgi:NADH:ubiquinone reductase (H+-translocating)
VDDVRGDRGGADRRGAERADRRASSRGTATDFRGVDTSCARIILLEGISSVLPPFPRRLQRYTQRELETMGVEIRLNTLAVDMDHDSVTVKTSGGLETI